MKNGELCVPAGALAEGGENGEAMTPGVGDTVEVQVTGRVTRTEDGEIYLQPTAVNGQPMESQEETDEAMTEREIGEGRVPEGMQMGGGALMAWVLFFAFLLGHSMSYGADLQLAKRVSTSPAPSTNTVFLNVTGTGITNGMQVFKVIVPNLSGAAGYAMVWDSNTNKLVNAGGAAGTGTPVAVRPVATGADVVIDFGDAGAPFYSGINVCLSTTPNTLTNGALGGYLTVVWSPLGQ